VICVKVFCGSIPSIDPREIISAFLPNII